MRTLFVFLLLTAALQGEGILIPERFQDGKVIDQVILICDVDGVVREGIEKVADPRILSAVKSFLDNCAIDVAFISGTPVVNDRTMEPWRRGNLSLSHVFGSAFEKEIEENRVTIYGSLGGQRMKSDGSLEMLDAYSLEVSFDLSR